MHIQRQIFLLSCGIYPSPLLGLHCEGHRPFAPSHSEWHSPIGKQFHIKVHASLNLPSMTCYTSTPLSNKTLNFINDLMSFHEKLPCSLSWSIAKQKLMTQGYCTFVTAAIMPWMPHAWSEFSHTMHCVCCHCTQNLCSNLCMCVGFCPVEQLVTGHTLHMGIAAHQKPVMC